MSMRIPKSNAIASRTANLIDAMALDVEIAAECMRKAAIEYRNGDYQHGANLVDGAFKLIHSHVFVLWKHISGVK